ncbi:MAG TPA: hypothetical protein VF573_28685 [Paraburkholderia sp.]|uniref:hypothetical protein n=1 Tax=Paraburkholderia sp. TaxID=1926495 RepID=UPI002ED5D026
MLGSVIASSSSPGTRDGSDAPRAFSAASNVTRIRSRNAVAELELKSVKNMGPVDEVQHDDAPAASRTESVKQRMKRNDRTMPPTLDEVLRRIADAHDAVELSAAGELATHLRTAYSDKIQSLRTAAREAKPPDDGAGAATVGPHVTFARVMDRLEKADSLDALDAAADLIRGVADEKQRDELEESYVAKRGRLDAAQA